jgi:hypothetical protein
VIELALSIGRPSRACGLKGLAAATELLGVAGIDVTAEGDALLGGLEIVNALIFDDLLEVLLISSGMRDRGREGDDAKCFHC